MREEQDMLRFYMEQTWQEMRHLETLRVNVSLLIIGIATLATGFISKENGIPQYHPVFLLVGVLGLFGAAMTRKLYELHQMGQNRLTYWYKYIKEEIVPETRIFEYRDDADAEHAKRFNVFSTIKHNHFWIFLNLTVSGVGFFLYFFQIK